MIRVIRVALRCIRIRDFRVISVIRAMGVIRGISGLRVILCFLGLFRVVRGMNRHVRPDTLGLLGL